MRALVLAPVELDGDAALRPQAVDGPRADGLVAQRQLDRAWRMSSRRKRALELGSSSGRVRARVRSAPLAGSRCPGGRGGGCARCRPGARRAGTRLRRGRGGARRGCSGSRGPAGCGRGWCCGKRPLRVTSSARQRPLLKSSTPSICVRARGTANCITEGGAGMMRQRQAAVPWLSSAPSPAANSAARRCPSSVSSSGATAAYTPAMDAVQPAGAQRATDRRAAHARRPATAPG